MMMHHEIGPIAKKLIAAGRTQQRPQLVERSAVRSARGELQRIIDRAVPPDDIGATYPGFAAYTYVANWVSGIVEAVQDERELCRHIDRIAKAEDEYMPSGPPMSPISRSMFNAWSLWDLTVGVKRESLGSILLAIGHSLGMDPVFLHLLADLVRSRLGLHVHEGVSGGRIRLRELGTGEVCECVCPAGYDGERGELWLARVLPPPALIPGESIVVTTPYVIVTPGLEAWKAYLDRTLATVGTSDPVTAYARLMKRGLDERFWLEYVFEAYANYQFDAIFLKGLPDVPESRPQSRVNRDRELRAGG